MFDQRRPLRLSIGFLKSGSASSQLLSAGGARRVIRMQIFPIQSSTSGASPRAPTMKHASLCSRSRFEPASGARRAVVRASGVRGNLSASLVAPKEELWFRSEGQIDFRHLRFFDGLVPPTRDQPLAHRHQLALALLFDHREDGYRTDEPSRWRDPAATDRTANARNHEL